MQPKTEELLNFLLWSAEKLAMPTYRNLTGSYESWAYRNGLLRQLSHLERKQLVVSKTLPGKDRVFRLTESGRLHALGGRDPEAEWSRPWDGKWRLAIFDISTEHNVKRDQLRRVLRQRKFGCLQGSVWISPDRITPGDNLLAKGEIHVCSLLFMEAQPCGGETQHQITEAAWDFLEVNDRYARYLQVLTRCPSEIPNQKASCNFLQKWANEERQAWLHAIALDPFLPGALLPPGYLGRQAWRRRIEVLEQARNLLKAFSL